MFSKNEYGYFAQKDLVSAENMLKLEDYANVCVFSQQCIEKSLKQIVITKRVPLTDKFVMKTHTLPKLVSFLKENKIVLPKNTITSAKIITSYYFTQRYPGEDYYDVDAEDAEEALESAREVFCIMRDMYLEESDEF